METTARVVIYNNSEIKNELNLEEGYIFIKRTKYKGDMEDIYYTIPGGHVEEGETPEQAVIREIEEELNINIEIEQLLIEMYNEDLKRKEFFYKGKYVSGILKEGNGPEFTNPDIKKYGKYEIVSVKKDKLSEVNLLPKEVKKLLIK